MAVAFRFSGIARTLVCPGSVVAQKGLPDRSGRPAREGTFAHSILARCITEAKRALNYLGVTDGEFTVDSEMARGVEMAHDYAWNLARQYPDAMIFSEQTVFPGPPLVLPGRTPDIGGTADLLIYSPTAKKVWVPDFKYGKNKWVPATAPQLTGYGMSALNWVQSQCQNCSVEEVEAVIIQPRCTTGPVPDLIRSQTYRPEELLTVNQRWASQLAPIREELAGGPPTPRIPGPDCHWCLAEGTDRCPETTKHHLQATGLRMEGYVSPAEAEDRLTHQLSQNPHVLTAQDRVAIKRMAPLIRGWLDAVDESLLRDLRAGATIEGVEIGLGRGSRDWKEKGPRGGPLTDDVLARKLLSYGIPRKQSLPQRRISAPQAEKLLDKAVLTEAQIAEFYSLIEKKKGAETVVLSAGTDPKKKDAIAAAFADAPTAERGNANE